MHSIAFKKRAPKGVKEVVKFAQKAMGIAPTYPMDGVAYDLPRRTR